MNFKHNAPIRSSKLSTKKGTIGLLHWKKTRKRLISAAMPLKNCSLKRIWRSLYTEQRGVSKMVGHLT